MFADLLPRFAAALRRLATGGPVHLSDLAATFELLQLSADAPGTRTRVVTQPKKHASVGVNSDIIHYHYIYNYIYIECEYKMRKNIMGYAWGYSER